MTQVTVKITGASNSAQWTWNQQLISLASTGAGNYSGTGIDTGLVHLFDYRLRGRWRCMDGGRKRWYHYSEFRWSYVAQRI